jgi:hypothetical protein
VTVPDEKIARNEIGAMKATHYGLLDLGKTSDLTVLGSSWIKI